MSQQFQIEVINVGAPISAPNGRGGFYHSIELAYKSGGKVMGRKIVDFVSKEVYETIKAAKTGDKFTVTSEKTDKGTNWIAIGGPGAEATGAAATDSSPEPERQSVRGRPTSEKTYETPEERATKQAIVTRLACVNAAIESAKLWGEPVTDEVSILATARIYETFIYTDLQARAESVRAISNQLKKSS